SINGITGSWSPAIVNTADVGTTTYTFNPVAGQCAAITSLEISISLGVLPTFAPIGPFCQNSAAPMLPAVSANGITGTWSPAAINTAITGRVNYTFTPNDPAQCGSQIIMAISITPSVGQPVFILGSTSTRCQGAGTLTYTATAVNSTNLTYSLDVASKAGGNTINSSTGAIMYTAIWSGTSVITVTANGCNGPAIAIHTVSTIPIPNAVISYNGSSFCTTTDSIRVTLTGTKGGAFSADPSGLSIDPKSGTISPSSSVPDTYKVIYQVIAAGGCGTATAVTTVTIITAPKVTIAYAGSPFCTSMSPVNVMLTDGSPGGIFSAEPAGLSIDAITGTITPETSREGSYTVIYTIKAEGGCGEVVATTIITITKLPVADFTYVGNPFCSSGSDPNPTFIDGGAAGTFTSTAGLVFIDIHTGQVDLSESAAGTYIVTNTFEAASGCGPVTASGTITIVKAPTAIISYPGSPFCDNITADQPVTFTGTTGGTYSATPAGLNINPATGAIKPDQSIPGTYTVTYSISASEPCGMVTTTTSVTITALAATISYSGSAFCTSSGPVTVILTGSPGGEFTSTPTGLTIDRTTGEITPATSAAGTYWVTYTTIERGCGVIQATALVTIILSPAATISYYGSPFCPVDPPASPIISGTSGGTFTSSPTGLAIDGTTGKIDPGTSLSGTYLITYSIGTTGGCGDVKATAEVTISSSTIVTTSPKNQTVVYPANAGFGVKATGAGLSYQWQVNTGSGFVNISNTGVYSGAFTDSLRLASPTELMSGYKFRVIVIGICAPPAISGEAILIVTLKEFVLTITAKGIDKMYDGNTNATVTLFDNRQSGDQLTITYTNVIFDTRNVSTNKQVYVNGIIISGPDAYKYGYNTTTTTIADIIPKPITVTADPGLSKVYGATDPIFTYTYTADLIKGDNFTGLLTRVPGENPGLYTIFQGTLTLGNNYIITFISNDFKITVKTVINVIVTAGQTKVYGETDPILLYKYYPELDPGDSFTGQLSRAQGENVEDYPINRGTLSVSPKYGIYLAPSTFTITPKPITITAVAESKVYNGTIASDEVPTISPNLVFDDTAEFIQTYDTKNVGTGKTMSPSGRANDGNNGKNYTVTYVTVDLGIITPKPIIGNITAADKVYDGTIAATILTHTLEGAIRGDDVSYVGGTATFDTPTVGKDKTVTGIGFSLSGADADNYTVNDTTTTKADINVLVVGTTLAVNASTFTHYSDQVTLTATVYGGAPLANGPQAAGSVTFSIEGWVIRDNDNNANSQLLVSGQDLVATITVSVLETTVTGSLVPGTKEATANFNNENINYKLVPNPVKASFDFSPGFNILVYPNPSPGQVSFKISVDVGAIVILELYASDGQLVARVFEGFIPTGESKTIPYHGYLAQGLYRYRARIGMEVKMGNVIIIGVY
ncbi:MAG: hypothetical protein D4R64_16090, partial [Porphyromonadaceae bacterium]